jgi:hypothetical protein
VVDGFDLRDLGGFERDLFLGHPRPD